ncbi:hypothetical protein [Beijerinckia sp. L45]|uniref:hypothetical protein n=1 Tax=Beijerinckia sp. L45 TaxID=1641855 RepID=UPI00131AA693|nr:hypothetical protein [Beijerinckia sp. L45]
MNPIHMKAGQYYWTMSCPTIDCKTKLVVAEADQNDPVHEAARKKFALLGTEIRCALCTKTTMVDASGLIFTEAR